MIFDHGCDAFNSCLNAMAMAKMYMLPIWIQAFTVVFVVSVFFMATLEQYFTHYFYLPKINAVNEGIVFLCIVALFTSARGRSWIILGGEIWLGKTLGITHWYYLFGFLVISTQVTVANHVRTIISKGTPMTKIIEKFRLFYVISLVFVSTVFVFRSEYPRADFYTYVFLFTKTTVIYRLTSGPNANLSRAQKRIQSWEIWHFCSFCLLDSFYFGETY